MKDEILCELIRQNQEQISSLYKSGELLLSLVTANEENVRKLTVLGLRLPAIKLYRKWKSCDLSTAKDFVDEICYGEEESKIF